MANISCQGIGEVSVEMIIQLSEASNTRSHTRIYRKCGEMKRTKSTAIYTNSFLPHTVPSIQIVNCPAGSIQSLWIILRLATMRFSSPTQSLSAALTVSRDVSSAQSHRVSEFSSNSELGAPAHQRSTFDCEQRTQITPHTGARFRARDPLTRRTF